MGILVSDRIEFEAEPSLVGELVDRALIADQKVPALSRAWLRDFYTAVEAVLSGFAAVCTDALRDVMEIENLLRDFSADVAQVEAWLSHDPRKGPRSLWPRKSSQAYPRRRCRLVLCPRECGLRRP